MLVGVHSDYWLFYTFHFHYWREGRPAVWRISFPTWWASRRRRDGHRPIDWVRREPSTSCVIRHLRGPLRWAVAASVGEATSFGGFGRRAGVGV